MYKNYVKSFKFGAGHFQIYVSCVKFFSVNPKDLFFCNLSQGAHGERFHKAMYVPALLISTQKCLVGSILCDEPIRTCLLRTALSIILYNN